MGKCENFAAIMRGFGGSPKKYSLAIGVNTFEGWNLALFR